MRVRHLFAGLLAGLTVYSTVAADEFPTTTPIVTTVVDEYQGAVGGVVVDQLGYVYVADFLEKVWRLNPANNQFELFASGFYGSSGNALDVSGNLYQGSYFGHTIHRITRAGEISTVLEEGLKGPVGMVFDDAGNLIIANCNDQSVKKLTQSGELSTLVTSTDFSCPNGITKNDDGEFFVVSFSSPKIMKVTPAGEISVFADTGGNGVGHIVYVRGVFYATSYVDNKIYRITADGEASLFSGDGKRGSNDGPVASATFSNPNGIAVDPTGTFLYVNDYVGDEDLTGAAKSPFSLRRIELPRLNKLLSHVLDNGTLESATMAYRKFRDDPNTGIENTENEMNSLGWKYMSQNDYEKAVFVFELNANSYPDSWRTHSSLGASYLRIDDSERAVSALKRSLGLNPENVRATDRLKELGAGL